MPHLLVIERGGVEIAAARVSGGRETICASMDPCGSLPEVAVPEQCCRWPGQQVSHFLALRSLLQGPAMAVSNAVPEGR
jgi:hypothetical protein